MQRKTLLAAAIAAMLATPMTIATVDAAESRIATASWYGPREHGRLMANGERYNQWGRTVAHRTLPFGTVLRLRANGKTVIATVTDRGPYIRGRHLDVSRGIARILEIETVGVARIEMQIVSQPPRKRPRI